MRKFKIEFRNLSSSYATTIQINFDNIYSLIEKSLISKSLKPIHALFSSYPDSLLFL